MAVIHIRDRVTEDEQVFGENALSDRSLLLLNNAAPAESFSLELTVGERWSENYGRDNSHMFRIGSEGVEIRRGNSIVVEVAQDIRVPHNMYGIVVPTGSLFLDRGTIIAAAKVEPSFRGRLKLRLVNTTGERLTLKPGEKVASIIFFATETTRHQPDVEKRVDPGERRSGAIKAVRRWLKTNHVQVIGWFVQLLGGAVVAALLIRYVLPPAPVEPAAQPTSTSRSTTDAGGESNVARI